MRGKQNVPFCMSTHQIREPRNKESSGYSKGGRLEYPEGNAQVCHRSPNYLGSLALRLHAGQSGRLRSSSRSSEQCCKPAAFAAMLSRRGQLRIETSKDVERLSAP